MNTPVLQVRNLITPLRIGEKTIPVVDRLSFDLHLGKTTAIVGESGCGKSMVAHSIMRILPSPPCLPSTGEVIYNGENLLQISEKKMRQIRGSKIAMIFQDPSTSLNPVYTIGNQLIEVAELHLNLYGEEAEERAIAALDEVGISKPRDRINDYPHQLSGGMKQRVMIAMALMCEPDILIADEPTTALDVTIQKQVLDLLRNLQAREKMAVMLITHDMGVVAETAHDVVVMYCSQEVEYAKVQQLFDRPAHPYTMGLLDSRPDQHLPKERLTQIRGAVPPLSNYPEGCRFHPRCPYAMQKCKAKEIPRFRVESGHFAKCLLLDGTKESINQFEEKRL